MSSRTKLGIFAAALLLRLLFVASVQDQIFFRHLQTEPLRYQTWATAIAAGRWAPSFPLDAGPGYPLFAGGVFKVAGPSLAAVAYLQAVLDALSAVLAAIVLAGVASAGAGVAAGVLWGLFGPAIYYVGQLLPVTPLLFFLWACIALGAAPPRWLARRAALRWLASGLGLAAAIAIRSEAALIAPFFAAAVWRAEGRRWALIALVPVVAYVGTMSALNFKGSPHWVPTTVGGGFNLGLGNEPGGDGVSPFLTAAQRSRADEIEARATGDVVLADRRFAIEAMHDAVAAPMRTLALACRKLLWLWHDRELPNTSDIDWERGQSWLFRLPLVPIGFGVLVPLALVGLSVRVRTPGSLWWVWATGATGVATCLLAFSDSRLRALLHPGVIGLAALGVLEVPGVLRELRQGQQRALAVAAAALGAIALCNANVLGVRAYRIPQIDFNTGELEELAGNHDAAVKRFRLTLATTPGDVTAWLTLARVLLAQGCAAQAETTLAAAARRPGVPGVVLRALDDVRRRRATDDASTDAPPGDSERCRIPEGGP